MSRAHKRLEILNWVVFLLGVAVFVASFVVWFATPWPTEAARYAWRQWRAPQLALALDRTDAPLAMAIGNTYFGTAPLGNGIPAYDPALAKSAFEKALSIEPGVLWGHYSLARIAFAKGDFAGALREINAELAANPDNLRSLYVRGLIYGYRGKPGDLALAESDFHRFTLWAPTEWAGYNDLSWILAKEGKYGDIASLMQRAFASVPEGSENPWLLNELGLAELNLGQYAAAQVTLVKAQAAAAALTEGDWRHAYSGDSPATDQAGLAAFRAAVAENLARAQLGA